MKPISKTLAIAGIVLIALIGCAAWYLAGSSPGYTGQPEPITVGTIFNEYSGLVFIAQDQDFFSANGLNVTFRDHASSVESAGELENGTTDITLVPEYTMAIAAFARKNISILGNIDKYQSVFLITRKDHGIEQIADLNGRKIGVSRGTIGEFYLGRFLLLNGISQKNVTLVPLRTSEYVDAIANGDVDAVVVVYMFLDQSRERLGDRLGAWPIQNSQKGYVVLVSRSDWAASHGETIIRFLQSLRQAEMYSVAHPAETRAIIGKRMHYSDATMAAVWPDHQYSLTLDQSLIAAMEDESGWMIQHNLTNATMVPDFRNYLHPEGLREVKPESVNIIGMT